jgi:hypothetical protein
VATLVLVHGGRWDGGEQLAALPVPSAVLPAVPENTTHRRATVDAVVKVVPRAVELPGTPTPPDPGFPAYLEHFTSAVRTLTVAP